MTTEQANEIKRLKDEVRILSLSLDGCEEKLKQTRDKINSLRDYIKAELSKERKELI